MATYEVKANAAAAIVTHLCATVPGFAVWYERHVNATGGTLMDDIFEILDLASPCGS